MAAPGLSKLAPVQLSPEEEAARRARVRRAAIGLGFVALSFYVAFIVMSVMRA